MHIVAFQSGFVVGSARRTELVRFREPFFLAYMSLVCVISSRLTCRIVMWKRKKDVKYLGSVHDGEFSEFYKVSRGVTDKVALDSVCQSGSQSLSDAFVGTEPHSGVVCQPPEAYPTPRRVL